SLARYTADGTQIWARKFDGEGNNEGLSVAADADDNIYLAGRYEGWFQLAGGFALSGGAYVTKLDGAGRVEWTFGIGGPESDTATGITVDSAGNVLVTGSVGSSVDFDPSGEEAKGGPGLFVAKYTSEGEYLWHFVKNSGDAHAIVPAPNDDVYVVGALTGSSNLGGGTHSHAGNSTDGFLLKVSSNGAYMWSKHLGSSGNDRLRAVEVDTFGNVYVTGDYGADTTFEGVELPFSGANGTLDEDAVLAKFSPDGQLAWAHRFGGLGQEWGDAVATTLSGDVLWGGHFEDTIQLGSDTLVSHGFGDLAIVRFAGTADGSMGCYAPGACSGNGACFELDSTATCACDWGFADASCSTCAVGFSGDDCAPACAGVTCGINQHCAPATGGCVCNAGHEGSNCDTCTAGYVTPSGCVGGECVCQPNCGTTAAPGVCATCDQALALAPGVGTAGLLV
ncbi:MAG: hypothetical protein ACI9OJ_003700, partial [Myxococcota bacterium]